MILGLLATIIMYVWPESEDSELLQKPSNKEDDEEISGFVDFLAQSFIGLPFLLCLGFGAYKISSYTQLLAF